MISLSKRINRIDFSGTSARVNEVAQLRASGIDLVDLGAGEPHFSTPQHIKAAAIEAIRNNFTKYTAVAGTAELRDAIVARHAQDFGSNYRLEESIASTGGKYALFTAIEVLVDHGDEVIIPMPYWVSFKDIVHFAGGTCIFLEAGDHNSFAWSLEMVERAITPRTKVIILNSPNNPTGAVIDPDCLSAIVQLAHRRRIYVISDECYTYLNFTGKPFSVGSLTNAREHLIIIGSLSKTYAMTGWRLGYALAPMPVISAMQKLQSQSISCPSSISQMAAIAALTGPQHCVDDMRSQYVRLRDRVLKGLRAVKGIRCTRPDGAFYVFPNISAFLGQKGLKSASDLADSLFREARVITVPGDVFGAGNYLRISYAVAESELNRGLERMQKFFSGF